GTEPSGRTVRVGGIETYSLDDDVYGIRRFTARRNHHLGAALACHGFWNHGMDLIESGGGSLLSRVGNLGRLAANCYRDILRQVQAGCVENESRARRQAG